MAYKRGSGTVQVELARLQSWVETTDPVLWGADGEKGQIEEHKERMMQEATQAKSSETFTKRMVGLCALFSAFGNLPKIIEWVHTLLK